MVEYFKGEWPQESYPDEQNGWSFYEVNPDTIVVTRIVNVFPSGLALRNSMELAEREGPDQRDPENRCVVHGNFDEADRAELTSILKSEFDDAWASATDEPWPPKEASFYK